MNRRDELDDVDWLFARLERAPVPEELTARVLASTVERPPATPTWPWVLAGVLALGVLVVAGYQVGVALAAGGGLDLLVAITGDVGLLTTAPGDVLAALGEVVPWAGLGVAALSAAVLILAVGNMASRQRLA